MGVWKRTKSCRFSEEELLMFGDIQRAASPFTRNFTQTVVMCGRIVWAILFTPGSLSAVTELLQRLRCTNLQYTSQLTLRFPVDPERAWFPKFGDRKENA